MRFSAPIAVVLALAVAPVLGRPRGIYDGLHARSWEDSLEARVAEHAFRLRAVDHGLHARDLEYALYAREADQDDLGARDLPAKAAKAVNRVKDALHLGPLKDNPEVPHLQALAAAEAVRKYGVTRAQADADRRAEFIAGLYVGRHKNRVAEAQSRLAEHEERLRLAGIVVGAAGVVAKIVPRDAYAMAYADAYADAYAEALERQSPW